MVVKTKDVMFDAGVVRLIEERFIDRCASGIGKDAVMAQKSIGWFVVLDTGAAFGFGSRKPDCAVGDRVFLEFRRSRHKGE